MQIPWTRGRAALLPEIGIMNCFKSTENFAGISGHIEVLLPMVQSMMIGEEEVAAFFLFAKKLQMPNCCTFRSLLLLLLVVVVVVVVVVVDAGDEAESLAIEEGGEWFCVESMSSLALDSLLLEVDAGDETESVSLLASERSF